MRLFAPTKKKAQRLLCFCVVWVRRFVRSGEFGEEYLRLLLPRRNSVREGISRKRNAIRYLITPDKEESTAFAVLLRGLGEKI